MTLRLRASVTAPIAAAAPAQRAPVPSAAELDAARPEPVGILTGTRPWLEPESHFPPGGRCTASAPPLLRTGTQHTIRVRRRPGMVWATLDGRPVLEGPGGPGGTVTVDPASGRGTSAPALAVLGWIDPTRLGAGPTGVPG